VFVVVVTGFSPSVCGAELVLAVLGPEMAVSGTAVAVAATGAVGADAVAVEGPDVDDDDAPDTDARGDVNGATAAAAALVLAGCES
jgi:hypothetical protein